VGKRGGYVRDSSSFVLSLLLCLNNLDLGLVLLSLAALAIATVAGAVVAGDGWLGGSTTLLAGSLDLELLAFSYSFSTSYHGGGRGEMERMEATLWSMADPVRFSSSIPVVRLLELRPPLVRSGGRWAASGGMPLFILVERRPCGVVVDSLHSSRPTSLKGGSLVLAWRSRLLPSASSWQRSYGDPIDPSGLVPGVDRVGSLLGPVQRTGLQSTFAFWGPSCKKQGRVCYLLFLLGPCVKRAVLFLHISNKV
jgi:hypothetical protein